MEVGLRVNEKKLVNANNGEVSLLILYDQDDDHRD